MWLFDCAEEQRKGQHQGGVCRVSAALTPNARPSVGSITPSCLIPLNAEMRPDICITPYSSKAPTRDHADFILHWVQCVADSCINDLENRNTCSM